MRIGGMNRGGLAAALPDRASYKAVKSQEGTVKRTDSLTESSRLSFFV